MNAARSARPVMLFVAALAVAAAVCAWLILGGRADAPAARNVLLISIDTCRADYLGCYGCSLPTTPNIDALAAESVLFENVFTPVPLTLPAHCSLLTGVEPPVHGVHDNFDFRLGPALTTLPEILRQRGLRTAAVISSSVMDSQFGLDRGFDEYSDDFERPRTYISEDLERRGDETTEVVEAWIEQNGADPFFLFVHYYDPHTDYDPPEPFASRFPGNPYAGEIAFTDACIGRVIEALKRRGLLDSTLIIVTSDHGEGLQDHGDNTHGFFIYNAGLKVPLVIRPPGGRPPRRVAAAAGLVDVVPTICGFLDIKAPPAAHGVDLTPYLTSRDPAGDSAADGRPAARTGSAAAAGGGADAVGGADADTRLLYCESRLPTKYGANPLHGLAGLRWKYIHTTRPELYDVQSDPGESANLAAANPAGVQGLRRTLEKIMADMAAEAQRRGTDAGSRFVMDDETRKKLRALGYVSGAVEESSAFDPGRDDPKDLIEFHVAYKRVPYLIATEQLGEAQALCEELIAQRPGYYGTYELRADIALKQKDFASAIPALLKLIEIEPVDGADFKLHKRHYQLGICYLNLKALEKAAAEFEAAVACMPDDVDAANRIDVLEKLGWIWTELGRDDKALDHFRRALDLNPARPQAHYNMALACFRTKDLAGAERHCRTLLDAMPGEVAVRQLLANVLIARGARGEAAAQLKTALDQARALGLSSKAAEIAKSLESLNE